MLKKHLDIAIVTEEGATLPHYSSEEASGADLKAFISQEIILQPGESVLVPTGLKFAIPSGFEIQIRPRSGLALKNQITVLNSPGTIDADYRGELGVILINHGKVPFHITPGLRIAQMVVTPIMQANFVKVQELSPTIRGSGGFGHTGVN